VVSLAERGDDARKVATCRLLGPVGFAIEDGLNQLLEFRKRALRPPRTQRQLELMAGDLRLQRWVMDPQSVEPGNAMPNLGVTPTDAEDIAAYLFTLD